MSGGPRFTRKQIVQAVVTVVIVVAIFVGVIPKIADYSLVWSTIQSMTWLEVTSLALVGAWNLFSYLPVLVAVLPGLRLREAFVSTEATTAIANTVPAGGAVALGLTFAMYESWGFTNGEIVRSILVSGVWNTFAKLAMPVVALALLAWQGDATASLLGAAVVGVVALVASIVVFGLLLRSEALARKVGGALGRVAARVAHLVRRPWTRDWATGAAEFRSNTIGLLERRWLWLTLATLVSHLSLFLVLLLCLRHVGVSEQEVSTVRVFAAFAFVRLLAALPITPGGVGVVELGYVAALGVGLDSELKSQIVAATLVFRALTYFLPIPLGVGTWLFWRRNKSWRKTVADRARERTGTVAVPAA
jgi:putative heme transporter